MVQHVEAVAVVALGDDHVAPLAAHHGHDLGDLAALLRGQPLEQELLGHARGERLVL